MKTLFSLVVAAMVTAGAAYAKETHKHSHEHSMAKQAPVVTQGDDLGMCPVMQRKASEDYSYTYQGKTYYFCCATCVAQFKKDPEKYISKIKGIMIEAYKYGFSPDVIKVKKGDVVRLTVASRDATHGIYIGKYDVHVPVKKDEVKKVEFIADKAGEFGIRCPVYCGEGHARMKAKLIVEK